MMRRQATHEERHLKGVNSKSRIVNFVIGLCLSASSPFFLLPSLFFSSHHGIVPNTCQRNYHRHHHRIVCIASCIEQTDGQVLHWYQRRAMLLSRYALSFQSVKFHGDGSDCSSVVVNLVPGLDQLGGESTTGSYKTGPQVHFLVVHMDKMEQSLVDCILKLTS
jgi:hypothetical protein